MKIHLTYAGLFIMLLAVDVLSAADGRVRFIKRQDPSFNPYGPLNSLKVVPGNDPMKLVLGTVTIPNTSVDNTTRIFCFAQATGTAIGNLSVTSRVAGVSYTVSSLDASGGVVTGDVRYIACSLQSGVQSVRPGGVGGGNSHPRPLASSMITLHQGYALKYRVTHTGPISVGTPTTNGDSAWNYFCSTDLVTDAAGKTGPTTVMIGFNGYSNTGEPAGIYSCKMDLTVGTDVETVVYNLTVVDRVIAPMLIYAGTLPTTGPLACGVSPKNPNVWITNQFWPPGHLEDCPTPGLPGFADFADPPVGSDYTDPTFGSTIRTVAATTSVQVSAMDSTNTMFNSDGSMILISTFGGNITAVSPTTGKVLYNAAAISPRSVGFVWDSHDPKAYYYIQGTALRKVVLGVSPDIATDTLVFDCSLETGIEHCDGTSISAGGETNASNDNFYTFWVAGGTTKRLYIIDLYNPTTHPWIDLSTGDAADMYYQGIPPRGASISKGISASTGYHYVVVDGPNGINYSAYFFKWKAGDSKVTGMGWVAKSPTASWASSADKTSTCNQLDRLASRCGGFFHFDTMQGTDGEQYAVYPWAETTPYTNWIVVSRMDKPEQMLIPVEVAGGAKFAYMTTGVGDSSVDVHIGCAKRIAGCVIEMDADPRAATWNVVSVLNTANQPVQITFDVAFPLDLGTKIVIGKVKGATVANGIHTVVWKTGNTVTLDVTGDGAAYSDYTTADPYWLYNGHSGSAVQNFNDPQTHRGEIHVLDFTKLPLVTVTRLAKHRNLSTFSQDLGPGGSNAVYYGQSHPGISPDGQSIAFQSNHGRAGEMGVFSIQIPGLLH